MKAFIWVLVAAIVGASAWYYFSRDPESASASAGIAEARNQTPLVSVEPVQRRTVSDTIEALGTAQANESVTLTSKVTDTIASINFSDGDYVEKGDILVQLTSKQEAADLAEAQAKLDEANNSLARVKDMWAKKLTSKAELDSAQSSTAAAQAHFESLAARLADHLIRAPFSGVLGFRQVSPGTLVQPSTVITTLDDISTIKLDFTVPEVYLQALKPGSPVMAHSISYPDRTFQGVVSAVGTRVDETTRAVPVRARVPNPDRLLRPGMLLTVDLTTATRSALVVPESAVYEVQDQAYVYRVEADRTVREQRVTIGTHHFGAIEVTAGLAEGDLIVTQGIIKLRDGIQVRYEEPAPEVSRASAKDPDAPPLSG